ncbi:MAG: class II aldolase/adducin family protein, partial [Candidatus Hadarchaeales archaeon]
MEILYSEEELKEEIVKTSRILYERGLITAIGGNISARIPGERAFWITPSQLCKSELKPEDIVKLDLECNQLEGFLKPSIEKLMHARVYKVRPEANAVVHAHNPITLGLVSSG